MIRINSDGLRRLAAALDTLTAAEKNTGVDFTGHAGETQIIIDGQAVRIVRRTDGILPENASAVYVAELGEG